MNTLLILGNGFDKAQGLATSYEEFYAYLKSLTPTSKEEQHLINSISADYKTWADLEEGLGDYTSQFDKPSEFLAELAIIKNRLKEYLTIEEAKLDGMNLTRPKLLQDLSHPEIYLEPTGLELFNSEFGQDDSPINIRCVSFNYTSTFESVMKSGIKSGSYLGVFGRQVFFQDMMHIHGILDELMLLGVNDEAQIANERMRQSADIQDEFIKPIINYGCMNVRNKTFSEWIESADVIVLFGVSIGKTDNKWWEEIGSRMGVFTPPLILYYPYDPSLDTLMRPNYKRRWTDEYIDTLKSKMKAADGPIPFADRVCVGINKDFLKLV